MDSSIIRFPDGIPSCKSSSENFSSSERIGMFIFFISFIKPKSLVNKTGLVDDRLNRNNLFCRNKDRVDLSRRRIRLFIKTKSPLRCQSHLYRFIQRFHLQFRKIAFSDPNQFRQGIDLKHPPQFFPKQNPHSPSRTGTFKNRALSSERLRVHPVQELAIHHLENIREVGTGVRSHRLRIEEARTSVKPCTCARHTCHAPSTTPLNRNP